MKPRSILERIIFTTEVCMKDLRVEVIYHFRGRIYSVMVIHDPRGQPSVYVPVPGVDVQLTVLMTPLRMTGFVARWVPPNEILDTQPAIQNSQWSWVADSNVVRIDTVRSGLRVIHLSPQTQHGTVAQAEGQLLTSLGELKIGLRHRNDIPTSFTLRFVPEAEALALYAPYLSTHGGDASLFHWVTRRPRPSVSLIATSA